MRVILLGIAALFCCFNPSTLQRGIVIIRIISRKGVFIGGVWINDSSVFRQDNYPYGGVKLSGLGREGVKNAMEEMTEMKFIGGRL
ncbi:aldehyde dehydrogenase family protein [Bacillus sp. ISL-55]|uniref:aldehyde dehydrogenase family protein n=1 Tax=Bacillus sp. ISL-55 TaxID=2819134 RepID=UPI001BECDF23|nr:aldehyde dehydrogenase family protein [Bacillus sp. ISL-55]